MLEMSVQDFRLQYIQMRKKRYRRVSPVYIDSMQ